MKKRSRLRYELIRNDNGHVVREFNNKSEGLAYSCQHLMNYPEDTKNLSFLVLERKTGHVVLRLTGDDLRQVCEDEGLEGEDVLGYEET
jgi:hypothetical protein